MPQHATERASYQTEIEHLRQQLRASQEEAAKLKEKLDTIEADHTEYLSNFEAVRNTYCDQNESLTDALHNSMLWRKPMRRSAITSILRMLS
jgi:peptidoglycan hydrolase CwlO-like protein